MFKKMFDKWKQEWFLKKQAELDQEFRPQFERMVETFERTKKEHEEKFEAVYLESKKKYQELIFQQTEIEELSKRLEERKLALAHENEELKLQLKLAEAKSSPSNVWAEAFTCGFSKAWDMMMLQNEGMEKVKKIIEDKAISKTISGLRLNGNNKTAN